MNYLSLLGFVAMACVGTASAQDDSARYVSDHLGDLNQAIAKYARLYEKQVSQAKAPSTDSDPKLIKANQSLAYRFLDARAAILDACAQEESEPGNKQKAYAACVSREGSEWNAYVWEVYLKRSPQILSDIQTAAALIAHSNQENLSEGDNTLEALFLRVLERSKRSYKAILDQGFDIGFATYNFQEKFFAAQALGFLESMGTSAEAYPYLHAFVSDSLTSFSALGYFQRMYAGPCGKAYPVGGQERLENIQKRLEIVKGDEGKVQAMPENTSQEERAKADAAAKLQQEWDQLQQTKTQLVDAMKAASSSQNECVDYFASEIQKLLEAERKLR